MKIPARMREHPIESLFAVALLLGLLFAPSDHGGAVAPQIPDQMAAKS